MKRIVLTLFVFIALSSLSDAARFYKCVDSRGNVIMTDNPPQDAKCEGTGGGYASTPEASAQKNDSLSARERRRADTDRARQQMRNQQADMEDKMRRQHKNSYMVKDAFGIPVNSDSFHMTRDAFGNIVGSDTPHMTKDAFGIPVNSNTPHSTRDAFGTIIWSE